MLENNQDVGPEDLNTDVEIETPIATEVLTEAEKIEPESDEAEAVEPKLEAPEWVKQLRKDHREAVRKNRELEAKLSTVAGADLKPVTVLGPKPLLEDLDFDHEVYAEKLESWIEQKKEIEANKSKLESEKLTQQQAWQSKLDIYSNSKADLKFSDFEESEETVKDYLSIVQQGIILQASKSAAKLVYALGQNSEQLKALSKISDPILFAFEIAKIEERLSKMSNKSTAPPPEKTIRGSTGGVAGSDSKLEKLRDEAQRTGDMSKLMDYKRRLKLNK